jgi:hypothetical protein
VWVAELSGSAILFGRLAGLPRKRPPPLEGRREGEYNGAP